MKRIIAVILTTVFLMVLTSCNREEDSADETPASDFEYGYADEYFYFGEYDYLEELTGIIIKRYIGESENVQIPKRIDGEPVMGIGGGAFMSTDVKSVIIPDSVKWAGIGIFLYCEAGTSVTYKGITYYVETQTIGAGRVQTELNDLPQEFYDAVR